MDLVPTLIRRSWTLKDQAERVGDFRVASGQLIAGDPLEHHESPALAKKVFPGRYPVKLLSEGGRRVALFIQLLDQEPVRWEWAICPGQEQAQQCPGYPVTGYAGFMDPVAAVLLKERADMERVLDHRADAPQRPAAELVRDVFRRSARNFGTQEGGVLMVDPFQELAVPFVEPVAGATQLCSYWGVNAGGFPCCLVTDLRPLAERTADVTQPEAKPRLTRLVWVRALIDHLIGEGKLELEDGADLDALAHHAAGALVPGDDTMTQARILSDQLMDHPSVVELYLTNRELSRLLEVL